MHILVAAPGDPYTKTNFLDQFEALGHKITHWNYQEEPLETLAQVVDGVDLFFHVYVLDEIPMPLLARIRCPKVLFCCDDEWRLPVSMSLAPFYDIVTTNDPDAMPLYKMKCIRHVRHVQYGVNIEAWRPEAYKWPRGVDLAIYAGEYLDRPFDVTFIGQRYIGRGEFLRDLTKLDGIKVDVWGLPDKPLSHKDMVQTLCGSKIVLGLNWTAGGFEAGKRPQIKGRLFETAALGAFQLVSADRRLSRYFADDEIATFTDRADCAAKIRYYLDRPELRQAMAKKAQERALREHTWALRWKPIFAELEKLVK